MLLGCLLQRAPAVFQHSFDCFLASSAILSHATARINVISTLGAAANRGADALFIEPIADADDHPTGPTESHSQ